MKLTTTTPLQDDLEAIEDRVTRTGRSLSRAVNDLNASHQALWGLPDDRLQDVLNYLLQASSETHDNKLVEVFESHALAVEKLNELCVTAGVPARAVIGAGREITIDANGVTVVPLPEPEVPEEPPAEPQPE